MSLTAMTVVRGETVTKKIQIYENGSPKDITGFTFKFGVKENINDTTYKIGVIDGVIDDAANGKVSFSLTSTHTDIPEFTGVYEIAMYSGTSKTVISNPGGIPFRLVESIID